MNTGFPQLLAREITTVQQFVKLLGEEQDALSQGKVEQLSLLTEAKSTLIDTLSEISTQRHAFLTQAGVAETRADVENWLQKQGNPKLLQAWKALQKLAAEAKRLNELNGQCIALLSRNNRQLLDAITGQQAKGTFYGPDGQPASSTGFRISDSV